LYLIGLIKWLCNLYQNSIVLNIFAYYILKILSVYFENEGWRMGEEAGGTSTDPQRCTIKRYSVTGT